MQAARSIAAVAFTAAALMMFAKPPGVEAAQAADPVRERAEDLARAASQRFSDVLKNEPQDERRRPSGGQESWGSQWLQRSTQEYKSVVRRLSQATGSAPAPTTPTQKGPADKVHPQAAGAPLDWLTWSSERFQEIMRKLAEGAAPPQAKPRPAVPISVPIATRTWSPGPR